MNFYAIIGERRSLSVRPLILDAEAQSSLSSMFGSLIDRILSADEVGFDPRYRPSDDEVVLLSPFELPAVLSVLNNAADANASPRLEASNLDEFDVRALAGVDWNGNQPLRIAFQKIESRFLLRRERWRLMFADGRFVRDRRPGLEIAERVDGVYGGNALHVAYWSNTHYILDLSAWIREATVAEMRAFLKHKKLSLASDFNSTTLADSVVRRKVASISASNLLDKCEVDVLQRYAKKFGVEVHISKGKIVMPAEKKEFKAVLNLLDEDLLLFQPTKELWMVNSKRKV
jgi:hypothetical protein